MCERIVNLVTNFLATAEALDSPLGVLAEDNE